jgi:FkbH-like protein
VERDEVRYVLPEVTIFDAADIHGLLKTPQLMPRRVGNESRQRREMYQADLRRRQDEEQFLGNKKKFLEGLGMRVTIRAASELDLWRAEELTVRTHQLNTTGRYFSYETLARLAASPRHLLLVADLEDRYGASGTVGLALIEKDVDAWVVKLLIASCRVLTRGIGGIMMTHIVKAAKQNGVRMRAELIPNDSNRIMYVALKFHGFNEVTDRDDVITLEHNLEKIPSFPRHVKVSSPDEGPASGQET